MMLAPWLVETIAGLAVTGSLCSCSRCCVSGARTQHELEEKNGGWWWLHEWLREGLATAGYDGSAMVVSGSVLNGEDGGTKMMPRSSALAAAGLMSSLGAAVVVLTCVQRGCTSAVPV